MEHGVRHMGGILSKLKNGQQHEDNWPCRGALLAVRPDVPGGHGADTRCRLTQILGLRAVAAIGRTFRDSIARRAGLGTCAGRRRCLASHRRVSGARVGVCQTID